MAGTPSNIITGPLSVGVSQNKTSDSASPGGGLTFTDLGFTEGGASVNDDADIKEFFGDQLFIPAAAFLGNINSEVKFNLAEPSIANLALVVPGGYTTSTRFAFGDPVNSTLKYYHLLLEMSAPNPNYTTLKYYFPRVVPSGSSKMPAKKGEATLIPVTYMVLLPDRITSNMITNGNFTGNATTWTMGGGSVAYAANTVGWTAGTHTLTQAIATLIPGVYYTLEYTISAITGAGATITASVNGTSGAATTSNSTVTETIKCGASGGLVFTPSGTVTTATIDSVRIYPAYAANRVLLV